MGQQYVSRKRAAAEPAATRPAKPAVDRAAEPAAETTAKPAAKPSAKPAGKRAIDTVDGVEASKRESRACTIPLKKLREEWIQSQPKAAPARASSDEAPAPKRLRSGFESKWSSFTPETGFRQSADASVPVDEKQARCQERIAAVFILTPG